DALRQLERKLGVICAKLLNGDILPLEVSLLPTGQQTGKVKRTHGPLRKGPLVEGPTWFVDGMSVTADAEERKGLTSDERSRSKKSRRCNPCRVVGAHQHQVRVANVVSLSVCQVVVPQGGRLPRLSAHPAACSIALRVWIHLGSFRCLLGL